MDSGDGAAARTEGARLYGRREHPEGSPHDAEAGGQARAADPVRDRTRAPDAGRLRDHSARQGSAGGVYRDARLEPGDVRRVRHRRAHGDAARLSRACVLLLRRRASRGTLRQHADGGDRAGSLRTGAASLQPHLPRLRASSRLRAAALPAYRPRTKGKVERFIRYLRASFYVPLASQLSPEGLTVDRDTANARVGTWLRGIANARVHATTGEIPAVRLEQERERLQPIPAPWPGTLQPTVPKRP